MLHPTVAGEELHLDADRVRVTVADLEAEPLHVHYVVVDGRRYPPKQVLAAVSGLDRADFTTHQARSVLKRLGFGVHRLTEEVRTGEPPGERDAKSYQAAEKAALEPFIGRWIAQDGLRVLYDGDSPEEVVRWLRKHDLSARVWRISARSEAAGSTLTTP